MTIPAETPGAAGPEVGAPAWGERLVVILAVVVSGLAFLAAVSPWATEPPGYSLDGFNVAVWGEGARAAVDDPVASRLGGRRLTGDRYADHPPLTVWATAVATGVGGDRPLVVRSPALVAGLLSLAVLALILRDLELDVIAVVGGVVLSATSGMFLAYGAMLDTPMVSLPVGLAAVRVGLRARQGRPPRPGVAVAVGVLAGLAGWQAALTVGLVVFAVVRRARRAAAALASGLIAGLAATAGWIAWVLGDLGPLWRQAAVRAGSGGGEAPWIATQPPYLRDLYGWGLLAAVVIGVLLAGFRPRRPGGASGERYVVAVLLVTIAGYAVLFRNGAAVHDYWTYWGVALVGVATAVLIDRAASVVRDQPRDVAIATRAGIGMVVVGAAVASWAQPSVAEQRIRDGLDLRAAVAHLPVADSPEAEVVAVYPTRERVPWVEYAVRGRAVSVWSREGLAELPPSLPVLVILSGEPSPALRDRADVVTERFAVLPAGDLVEHLGG